MHRLTTRLSDLLDAERKATASLWGKPMRNPLSGEPGFVMKNPYPDGATSQLLDDFESRTGVKLPSDVREWLTLSNGAAGFFGIRPDDEDRDIEGIWRWHPVWRSRKWIPVGRDLNGNFFVRVEGNTTDRPNAVYFVEGIGDDCLQYAVASDAMHYAEFAIEELIALDETGNYPWPLDRDFVLAKDPALKSAPATLLLWNL